MTPLRNAPPQRVPTLTEVVQLPAAVPDAVDAAVAEAAGPELVVSQVVASPVVSAPVVRSPDEADLAQRVLFDVQRQIDLMLEYRLREALGPVLARISEAVIREARDELASTLRDVVARAVAQEITRHRGR